MKDIFIQPLMMIITSPRTEKKKLCKIPIGHCVSKMNMPTTSFFEIPN